MNNNTLDNSYNNNVSNDGKNNYFICLLVLTILLFFCVFGITYSVYKSDSTDNIIDTGEIIFSYSDVGQAGNGIYIKNATPLSDEVGKVMIGSGQYFDFSTTSSTKNSKINYKILVNKDSTSTLSDNNVKIYLTQLFGGIEKDLVLDNFSNLKQETINNKKYYVLYDKVLEKALENYSDMYRLRLWVDENAVNYDDQYFSIKIDVYAYQIKE